MVGNKHNPKGRSLQDFEKMKIPGFEDGIPRSASFYLLKMYGVFFPHQSKACEDCRKHQVNPFLKDFKKDEFPEFETPKRYQAFLAIHKDPNEQSDESVESKQPQCDIYFKINNTFLKDFKCAGEKLKIHQDVPEEEAFLIHTRILALNTPMDTEICTEHVKLLGNDYNKNNHYYCRWPNHSDIQKFSFGKKKVISTGRELQNFGQMDIPGFENGIPRSASFYLHDQHGIFFPYESLACYDCRAHEAKELLTGFNESDYPEFSTPKRYRAFLEARGIPAKQDSEPMDWNTPEIEGTPPNRSDPETPQTPHGLPTGMNVAFFSKRFSIKSMLTHYRSWWFEYEGGLTSES